jgi:uncharacterized protein with transglutaminase domain/transglutaminase superfamily protein
MSRTTLCVVTAAGLALGSLGLMIARYCVLGDAVLAPRGPDTWHVTLLVNGVSTSRDAKFRTAAPLELGHQHLCHESFRSKEFSNKPPASRQPYRRQVLWSQRGAVPPGAFRVAYEFYCQLDRRQGDMAAARYPKMLYHSPGPGEFLQPEAKIESDHSDISVLARNLTESTTEPSEQLESLFRYVDQKIGKEPAVGAGELSAVQCLKNGRGDSGAKSRLLVALCRNRGIPARMVTGLMLARGRGQEQVAHYWAEAWVDDHWKAMCPFYHYDGHVPATFLIFGIGDLPVVQGKAVHELDYAFLIEPSDGLEQSAGATPSLFARLFRSTSLYALPPSERRLVELLMLLPVAALMVCVFRNVIGLNSFGTFAPALVGLAFREFHNLPGILIFVALVLIGSGMRRILDRYHLLQVPRTALMLTLVVVFLIGGIVAANAHDLAATKFMPLFPMIILTGMIERFWTLEVEDGTYASFKTMLGTMFIAMTIALVLGIHALVRFLFQFPEVLGFIMSAQLLLGRYTGYRLSELFRFRDLLAVQGS